MPKRPRTKVIRERQNLKLQKRIREFNGHLARLGVVFASRVYDELDKRRWTVHCLADKICMNPEYLQRTLDGDMPWTIHDLANIEMALDIQWDLVAQPMIPARMLASK